MKKLLLLSLLLLAVVLGSCYKDADHLTPEERALVGTWKFEKVKYHKSLFKSDNITEAYDGVRLEFKADKSLIYDDNGSNITGKWRLDPVSTPCHDPNGNCANIIQYRLLVILLRSGEIDESVWESVYISKRQVSATEQEGRSARFYYYELEKY